MYIDLSNNKFRKPNQNPPTVHHSLRLSSILQQDALTKSSNINMHPGNNNNHLSCSPQNTKMYMTCAQNNQRLRTITFNNIEILNNKYQPQSRSISRQTKNSKNIHSKQKQVRQQLVYINGKGFLSTRIEQPHNKQNSHIKIVEIANRSKSRSINKNHESIITKLTNPTQTPYQINITRNLSQKINNQNRALQSLLKKISILQKRIGDLHRQNQNTNLKYSKQNQILRKQLLQKQIIIDKLAKDLQQLNQSKTKEERNWPQNMNNLKKQIQMLRNMYENQRQQNMKYKMDIQYHQKAGKSLATQNFISLTLQAQIQELKCQNNQLMHQISQLFLKQNKRETENTDYQLQVDIQLRPTITQIPLPLAELPQIQQICNLTKYFQQAISVQYFHNEDSKKQLQKILQTNEIDSQQMQVSQIIDRINKISSQNQQLKSLLQQNRSQLFIQHTVAQQTMKIIQQINNIIDKQIQKSSQYKEQSVSKSLKQIKQVINQIY